MKFNEIVERKSSKLDNCLKFNTTTFPEIPSATQWPLSKKRSREDETETQEYEAQDQGFETQDQGFVFTSRDRRKPRLMNDSDSVGLRDNQSDPVYSAENYPSSIKDNIYKSGESPSSLQDECSDYSVYLGSVNDRFNDMDRKNSLSNQSDTNYHVFYDENVNTIESNSGHERLHDVSTVNKENDVVSSFRLSKRLNSIGDIENPKASTSAFKTANEVVSSSKLPQSLTCRIGNPKTSDIKNENKVFPSSNLPLILNSTRRIANPKSCSSVDMSPFSKVWKPCSSVGVSPSSKVHRISNPKPCSSVGVSPSSKVWWMVVTALAICSVTPIVAEATTELSALTGPNVCTKQEE